ncbi:hypothetical protein [Paenibacillus sinopodophylli]|uniref:hypothetical protein n=1 Tax=Paenibacillus sinopodophylli TaxID=1837342 RepID=UPI00110D0F52|nr:hypothetical protein [Paenibacillus sinopodophylli]
MSAILLISLLCAWAIFRECMPLVKKKLAKDAVVYMLLLLTGASLSICNIRLIEVPSPMLLLQAAYGPLLKWLGLQ